MKKVDFKELELEVKKILNQQKVNGIEVGFMESAKYPNGDQVAFIAYTNNYGLGVPQRPFFNVALSKNANKWVNFAQSVLQKQGKIDFTKAFNQLAIIMVTDIQKEITDMRTPPNSQKTIEIKKSSNPLIDTGLMRRSVTYRVIK